MTEFLKTNGAAVRVNDAGRRHGQIVVQAGYGYVADETIPTVVLRNEDYGRIARLLADDIPVTLEFKIVNRTYPDAHTQYNVIAEIPGTDKADEVVMLGAHLDSWHGATGATDNAIGSAIMMEAVRILHAVGASPRRTIRVALWGGEEQGLLGSQAYVARALRLGGEPEAGFAKFSAYWNIDTGTGRIRGASVFGPPESARILARAPDAMGRVQSPRRDDVNQPERRRHRPARRSTVPDCPASARRRIPSSTTRTRITSTSTPTNASLPNDVQGERDHYGVGRLSPRDARRADAAVSRADQMPARPKAEAVRCQRGTHAVAHRVRCLGWHDGHEPQLARPKDGELRRDLDQFVRQVAMQVVDAGDCLPAKPRMMSPVADARARRRAVGSDRLDSHAGRRGQLTRAGERARNRQVLSDDADVAAPEPAVANEPRRDEPHRVAGDREAEPWAGEIIAVLMPITSPRGRDERRRPSYRD